MERRLHVQLATASQLLWGLPTQRKNKLSHAKCCNVWLEIESRTLAKSWGPKFWVCAVGGLFHPPPPPMLRSLSPTVFSLLRQFAWLGAQIQIIEVNGVWVSRKFSLYIMSVSRPLPLLIKWSYDRQWTTIHDETMPIGWKTALLKNHTTRWDFTTPKSKGKSTLLPFSVFFLRTLAFFIGFLPNVDLKS